MIQISHGSKWLITSTALALSVQAALAQVTPANPSPPVIIGVNIPRTGPAGFLGSLSEQAINLAVEQINSGGGIKSLGGAHLELRWADNQAQPSLAASEEQRLIQREMATVVIGGLASGAELTATQMAERLKVPHVIGIAAANELTERGLKYTFLLSCRAVDLARTFVAFLDSFRKDRKIDVKKVIVLNENSPFGSSVGKDLVSMLPAAGYAVADHIEYAFTSNDMSPLLARIRAANPDVVLQSGYVGDSILIWNTRKQMGMENIPFIAVASGIGSPAFMKAVGNQANGAFSISQTNSDIPKEAIKKFVQSYQSKYNVEPENNGFLMYQAVYVIRAALEKAASRSPEALRETLATLVMNSDVVLPEETIQFESSGANRCPAMLVLQIKDARLKTVWPAKSATTQPDLTLFDKSKQ